MSSMQVLTYQQRSTTYTSAATEVGSSLLMNQQVLSFFSTRFWSITYLLLPCNYVLYLFYTLLQNSHGVDRLGLAR
jgi:amino acid permease